MVLTVIQFKDNKKVNGLVLIFAKGRKPLDLNYISKEFAEKGNL